MTALTAPRAMQQLSDDAIPELLAIPQKGSTILWPGAMVAISGGYAIPAKTAPGLKVVGLYYPNPNNGTYAQSDTTGLADGAVTIQVMRGAFKMVNSAAGADQILQANVGQDCYAVDDNVVALTDGGGGARSRAGKVIQLDSVDSSPIVEFGSPKDGDVKIVPLGSVDLASIAAGLVKAALTMPFGGTVLGFYATVGKAATTAAKAATLTPRITPAGGAATAVTGGALAATSANMTPLGAIVNAAAITAANTFKAGDAIDINASAVTAFVEGNADLFLIVGP
jgi:hypothetical protein